MMYIFGSWRDDLPDYRRTVVSEVLSDIAELPQIFSITDPRRVGKTTISLMRSIYW